MDKPETAETATRTAPEKSVQSITVIGRRWFDKVNGNTYHSAITLVNGKPGPSVGFQYGYGSQWEYNAAMELDRAGIIQLESYGEGRPKESLWRYCERNGIAYSNVVSDHDRKRDVKGFGQ
jgi:hypothetical protein